MGKKIVASISGGQTSHYMVDVLIGLFGKENCDFIFCDTGAENEGTYKFVRDTEDFFDIKITYLRMHLSQEDGVGCEPVVTSRDEAKRDFGPFKELMAKYGRPFNPGGKFCTDQMKTQIARKYCNDKYGLGKYEMWIGYRDEPKDSSRVWGHTLSGTISKWLAIPQRNQGEFYKECTYELDKSIGHLFDYISSKMINPIEKNNYKRLCNIADRVVKNRQLGYRFLFEVSEFDKQDINEFWEEQEFKLNIPLHTGNCEFCIEKTVNQLAYLIHTQPEAAKEWGEVVNSPDIPSKNRKVDELAMYRNGKDKLSWNQVVDLAMSEPLEHWEERMGMEKRLSPCAGGSCDLYAAEGETMSFDF